MRLSGAFRMNSTRLTLFTRANCSLCETAKANIAEVQKKRQVDYTEIDVMARGQEAWKGFYEFDVPVLHVQRVFSTSSKPVVSEAKKLMHRFSPDEIESLVDEAQAGSI